MKRGLLITFEGIDGCGKTTQIQELIKRFDPAWTGEYLLVREPGGTPICEQIRQILLDNANSEMFPITELLLYSASRHQLCREAILPALKKGKIVLCDRFYDSTTAYQGYGRGIDLEFIHQLNRLATDGLIPDLTFIFDISLTEREKRLLRRSPDQVGTESGRGKSKDRLEAGEPAFQQRVREGFRKIAAKEPQRVHLIDGMQPVEVIAEEVWQTFQTIWRKHSHANE